MTNDLTIKQAVGELKAMKKHIEPYMSVVGVTAYDMAIKALEPKTGHWIFKNDNIAIPTGYYQCSECEEGKLLVKDNFCPNCGSYMGGEEDG